MGRDLDRWRWVGGGGKALGSLYSETSEEARPPCYMLTRQGGWRASFWKLPLAMGHYTRTEVWTRSSSGDHHRCLGEEAQGEHAPRDHTEAGRPRKTKKFPKKALRTWMRQVEPRTIILIRRIW